MTSGHSSPADAARIIGEATTEELGRARALFTGGDEFWDGVDSDYHDEQVAEIAAAALALVIEGRESGMFSRVTLAMPYRVAGMPESLQAAAADAALLRALAGDRKEGTNER